MFGAYFVIWILVACGIVGVFSIPYKISYVLVGIMISVFLLIPGFLSIPITTTQSGEHTGYITAIQETGYIWKNYRIYVKTDNSSSQEDIYCLPKDSQLANELRELSKKRELVTISYEGKTYLFMSYSKCSGDIITGVLKVK